MAASNRPNVVQVVTNALVAIGDVVPALFAESVSLRASLNQGVADAYIDVWVEDTLGANEGFLCWQEPVRYRVQGGAPDLLMNFVLNAGQQIQVRGSTTGLITATLFGRYRFDA